MKKLFRVILGFPVLLVLAISFEPNVAFASETSAGSKVVVGVPWLSNAGEERLTCPTRVTPEIPGKAIADGTSGVVRAHFLVVDGQVREVTDLKGPRVFHAAVKSAIMQYKCNGAGEVNAIQEFAFITPKKPAVAPPTNSSQVQSTSAKLDDTGRGVVPANITQPAGQGSPKVATETTNPSKVKANSVAVLSLIGDSMGVVVYRGQTGTRLPTTDSNSFPIEDSIFDKTVLIASDDVIRKSGSRSEATLLGPNADLYRAQSELVKGEKFEPTPSLKTLLLDRGATHLILFTKHKGEARLKMERGSLGAGSLQGIGYYVDYSLKLRRSDTGESGTGFLAPYTYFKVHFIDLTSSTVLKDQTITEATTMSAARNKDGVNPWDVLNGQQKIDLLRNMLRSEVSKVLPSLLSGLPASETNLGDAPKSSNSADPEPIPKSSSNCRAEPISIPAAEYPKSQISANGTGIVYFRFLIAADGSVVQALALENSATAFISKTLETVRAWRFKPLTCSKELGLWVTSSMTFSLQ